MRIVAASLMVVPLSLMASTAMAEGSAQAASRGVGTSQSACFQASRTFVRIPMPWPMVLGHPVQMTHLNGGLTLHPAPTTARPAISPQAVWSTIGPQNPRGIRQLVLAHLSSSIPATLQPDGSLRPTYQHVLAWVDYGKRLPFDTSTASQLLAPPPFAEPTCTFVGQGITAWDGMTGKRIMDSEFVPNDGRTLHLQVQRWDPLRSHSSVNT